MMPEASVLVTTPPIKVFVGQFFKHHLMSAINSRILFVSLYVIMIAVTSNSNTDKNITKKI